MLGYTITVFSTGFLFGMLFDMFIISDENIKRFWDWGRKTKEKNV